MHCEACGARTNPGARFCAACGAPLSRAAPPGPAANAGVAPEPAREPEPRPPFAPVSTRRSEPHGYGALAPSNPNLPAAFSPGNALAPGSNWRHTHPTFCLACQQRTVPVPFFSRGFNLAKAAALLPLSPIAPLVFFLVRRDRLVCSWCKSILPGEASLSLLDSFSPAPAGLMGGGSESDALMRSADAVHNEVALHEHKSRRSKRRATTFGLASLMFAGIGGTVALEQGAEEATFFFSMGGLSGIGAVTSSRRGKRHQIAAEAKRQRFHVLEVLNLARANGGKLTVTAVAAHMRLDLQEAEALLDGMVDGRRVDVHVDEGGRMNYVFTELAG